MNDFVFNGLKGGYTPYHAVKISEDYLAQKGFVSLSETSRWEIKTGGKYFVKRGDSSLIAFTVGRGDYRFKIISSHVDSPALKVKYNPVEKAGNQLKLNVETYGGGIWHTFADVPLALCGRLAVEKNGKVFGRVYTDPHTYVIPNVAIHMNRKANEGFVYNPQIDLCPLFGTAGKADEYFSHIVGEDEKLVGYDLFLVNKTAPFYVGADDEFFCSGRIDNLLSAFSSVEALVNSNGGGISLVFLADSEEVGSRSNEGADSDFLRKTMSRINRALGYTEEDFDRAVSGSFGLSADNAHAVHPNHPELSDPTNKTELGGGVVFKFHANRNYTTTSLLAGAVASVMRSAGIKTQDFFMRSDLKCGSTLGAISSSQISVPCVDIGMPQLAMHSSMETASVADADAYLEFMTTFFNSKLKVENGEILF
ncbi:MAG: M18 family aminopeptidase [Clostridia bacterium]|nr:M18 family aminopeptidase [Clostridia bacterium]